MSVNRRSYGYRFGVALGFSLSEGGTANSPDMTTGVMKTERTNRGQSAPCHYLTSWQPWQQPWQPEPPRHGHADPRHHPYPYR